MSESTEVTVPWLHPGEVLLLKLKTAVSQLAEERLRVCMKELVDRAKDGPTIAVLEEGATFEILRSGWIPVSERLPEQGVWVLVYRGALSNDQVVARRSTERHGWNALGGSYLHESSVTHWMPLPEEPR